MTDKPSFFRIARRSFWLWFGTIVLAVGLPFLLTSLYFLGHERRFRTEGQIVEAVVLTKDIDRSRSNNRESTRYSVTYRFTAPDRRAIRGSTGLDRASWETLTERGPISVVYLPGDPESNRMAGQSKMIPLTIFGGLGGFLTFVGALLAWHGLRTARTKWRVQQAGVLAPATVTDVIPLNLRVNNQTRWRLHYDFRDYQGRAHQKRTYLPADEARLWKKGDVGNVLFDPANPKHVVWIGKAREAAS
jgi:uncharacterized protein DUF3592